VQQETLLQGDLQAVGEKGDQNVRVGAMFQLMVEWDVCPVHSSERNTDSIVLTAHSASTGRGSPAVRLGAASSVRGAIPPLGLLLIHTN